jgi:transcriptional regulator with XRE-family HTH domain
MMYEVFAQLLQEKGITPYRVHKETGVAQSTLSDWKTKGCTPSVENLVKIAKYLDVTVDALIGQENKKPVTKTDDGLSKLESDFIKLLRRVPEDQRPMLFAMIEAALKAQGLL